MIQLIYAIGKGLLNVFLSIILGGIAVVVCNYQYPEFMDFIQVISTTIKSVLKFVGLIPTQTNTIVNLLLDDNQFAFLFFVLAARVILAIISTIYSLIFDDTPAYREYQQRPRPRNPNPNNYRQPAPGAMHNQHQQNRGYNQNNYGNSHNNDYTMR